MQMFTSKLKAGWIRNNITMTLNYLRVNLGIRVPYNFVVFYPKTEP